MSSVLAGRLLTSGPTREVLIVISAGEGKGPALPHQMRKGSPPALPPGEAIKGVWGHLPWDVLPDHPLPCGCKLGINKSLWVHQLLGPGHWDI